jgi:hypothetical protein
VVSARLARFRGDGGGDEDDVGKMHRVEHVLSPHALLDLRDVLGGLGAGHDRQPPCLEAQPYGGSPGIATRHVDAALGDRGVDLVVVAQHLQEAGTAEVDPHAAPGQVDLERLPLHGDGGRLAPEEQEEAARQDVRHPDRILPLPGGAARPRRPPS